MSVFNKKGLALALAAALAMPLVAQAYDVTTDGDSAPENIATQVGANVTMTEQVQVNTKLPDVIIGRTTGFQILVTLQDGATFGAAPPSMVAGSGLTGGWTISLAAGGTPGDTQAQFVFSPTTSGSQVTQGTIATIDGLQLNNTPTAMGSTVSAEFRARDPVSAALLHTTTQKLIIRNNGLAMDCAPNANPYKIDIGESEDFAPKTGFVAAPYPIGGADADTANLGEITLEANSSYDILGTDTFNSTFTGDFNGFTSIFLATDATCSTPIAGGEYTINPAKTQATLNTTFADLGSGAWAPNGGTGNLCVSVDGETPIASQDFNVINTVNGNAFANSCPVAGIAYNGSVVKVYHVNPADTPTAQSYVRVINPTGLPGKVSVIGWDDAGTLKGPITYSVGARASKQINSFDLEEGNVGKGLTGSFGDGVGKWRLEITGEFDGMVVQSMNRNRIDGTVTNHTDADTRVEQVNDGKTL